MMLGDMLAGLHDDTKASEIIFSLGNWPLLVGIRRQQVEGVIAFQQRMTHRDHTRRSDIGEVAVLFRISSATEVQLQRASAKLRQR
jgi:hypothetical protein